MYPSSLKRIVACLIDMLVLCALFAAIYTIDYFYQTKTTDYISNITFSLLGIGYFIFMTGAYGATFGKIIMKLKVYSENDGAKCGYRKAIKRYFVYIFNIGIHIVKDSYEYYGGVFPKNIFTERYWTIGWYIEVLVTVISIILWVFIIIDIGMFLVNKKHISLHDKIGKTIVNFAS